MGFISVLIVFAMLHAACMACGIWLIVRSTRRKRAIANRCGACRYDLRGSPSIKCPECGHPVASPAPLSDQRQLLLIWIGVGLIMLPLMLDLAAYIFTIRLLSRFH